MQQVSEDWSCTLESEVRRRHRTRITGPSSAWCKHAVHDVQVVHVSDGGSHTEPVVVLGGALLQERLPPDGLPLPAALLHPRLRDFLSTFVTRFEARLAEIGMEVAPERSVALSLADLIGTGALSADEAAVRASILQCGERCAVPT